MEVSGLLHGHAALLAGRNPGTHQLEGCVGPSAGLGVLENRKMCLSRDSCFCTWRMV